MKGTLVTERTSEILQMFAPVEGFNYVYYGQIRNGKTYAATCDILDLLKQGEVVYANWDIDFSGFDQREHWFIVLIKLLTGKKYFYKFNKDNFHYIDTRSLNSLSENELIKFLNKLVGVHLFLDEAQWIFNSHARTDDIEKRKLILEGGHYCRSLNVITQRPVNILKDVRSQIHVWYKCVKRLSFGKIILFARFEFQEMKDDLPDEENPTGRPKHYFGRAKIFNAYNTHARRSEDAIVEIAKFEVYELSAFDKIKLLASRFVPRVVKQTFGRRIKRRTNVVHPRIKENKSSKKWRLLDIKKNR